jgi:hypothetical protein
MYLLVKVIMLAKGIDHLVVCIVQLVPSAWIDIYVIM